MENYGIMIGAILTMLLGSLVATYLGHSFVGLLFLVLALTPWPVNLAYRLRDLIPVRRNE